MGEAKRKQQRECPAKQATITREECGRGRNSTISCPVDCVFNPFALANYADGFAKLESKVIHLLTRKLLTDLTPSQLRELGEAMQQDDIYTSHALQAWHIHGEGRLEKWKEEGFLRDWKNDEVVMLGFMATIRPALLEFRETLDENTCMAVDLLRPELPPFVVIDGAAATHVGRFDVMLGWVFDLPAGQRLSGSSIVLPDIEGTGPSEVFQRLLDHLGAPSGDPRAWLMEHMPLLAEAFTAIDIARQEKRIRISDLRRFVLAHDLGQGQAAALIAALEADPRILADAPGEDGKSWGATLIAEGTDRDRDVEARAVGHFFVHADRLEFEAIGEEPADQGRRFIAALPASMGPEQASESDLAPPSAAPSFDPGLVPPAFLETVGALDLATTVHLKQPGIAAGSELALHYRNFADIPLPALDGHSPRDAAADPVLRPKLLVLMKGHISRCDRERRTNGVDFDLNPLLAELGLDEIILPPPPLGFIEPEEDEIFLDPPPSQPLLEGDQLEDRIQMVTGDDAIWNRIELRLADILDAFNDLPDKLNPHELEILQTTALSVLGALHPDQVPGYEPDADRMLARYESWMAGGDAEETLADYLDRIFKESRQPEVCEAAADLLLNLDEQSGKKLRQKKLDVLLTALAAAIWEVAHWPPLLK